MVKAYILINTEPDTEYDVVKVLRTSPGIKAADVLFGYYDIVATIEVESLNRIGETIAAVRAKANGISKTSTMIVKEDYFEAVTDSK